MPDNGRDQRVPLLRSAKVSGEKCPGCGRFATDVAAVKHPISQVQPEPDYRCGRCRGVPASMLEPIEFDDEPEPALEKPNRDFRFDPDDIPVADEYSREDFGTPDEVRGWNLCREYVISMVRGESQAPRPRVRITNCDGRQHRDGRLQIIGACDGQACRLP